MADILKTLRAGYTRPSPWCTQVLDTNRSPIYPGPGSESRAHPLGWHKLRVHLRACCKGLVRSSHLASGRGPLANSVYTTATPKLHPSYTQLSIPHLTDPNYVPAGCFCTHEHASRKQILRSVEYTTRTTRARRYTLERDRTSGTPGPT